MKIEVNLAGIFSDEDGNEIEPSVRDEIVTEVCDRILRKIDRDLETQISKVLSETIKIKVEDRLSGLIPELLDFEFKPKDKWGSEQTTTTVRNEIFNEMKKQIVYEKRSYDSDKNIFSKVLDNVVSERFKAFEAEYRKLVDGMFTQEAFAFAQKKLQEKLNIK